MASEEAEGMPFIGDVYDIDKGIFLGTSVLTDSVSVSSLRIQDNVFEIEVALSSKIEKSTSFERDEDSHVVIGVEIELPKTGPVSVTADVLKDREETVILPLGILIEPGKIQINNIKIAPIKYLQILKNFKVKKRSQMSPDELKEFKTAADLRRLITEMEELKKTEKYAVLPPEEAGKFKKKEEELSNLEETFLIDLFNCLQDLNSKNWIRKIESFAKTIDKCNDDIRRYVDGVKEILSRASRKIPLVRAMKTSGVENVTEPEKFEELIGRNESYAIFYSERLLADDVKAEETFRFFFNFKKHESVRTCAFFAVDLDAVKKTEFPAPKKVAIRRFVEKECVVADFVRHLQNLSKYNAARTNYVIRPLNSPEVRGRLKIPCPNSFNGKCEKTESDWFCEKCNDFLDYGYDGNLYCGCGGSAIKDYEFRCNDFRHGTGFVKYDYRCDSYLNKIKPREVINILILGQSGVGKSTWINSIINYVVHDEMEEAKNNLIIKIPMKVTIRDRNATRTVVLGEDANEVTEVGESATQDCKTYVVKYKDYDVRIIDTPGLGDVRGPQQDKMNVKRILEYIAHYKSLNGICVLLKSGEKNIQTLLKYSTKEILSNLHKNSAENLVYCFTHSRVSFYNPGESLPVLKMLLRQINVPIPDKDKIYCFDNESLEYLCASRYERFSRKDDDVYSESWRKGVEETKRLFDHVANVPPHDTGESLSLNQARRLVLSMSKPTADIAHNIEINITAVRGHKKLIEEWDENDKDLRKALYVPQIVLEKVQLGYPRTVCTNETCVKEHVLPDSEVTTVEYVTHCHVRCYLSNVVAETYPNPALKGCAAMAGTPFCRSCGCSWEKHMHVLYELKRSETRVENQYAQSMIGKNKNLRTEKEATIKQLQQQIEKLQEEKKKIITIAGKFAQFLKSNAITTYNDSFKEYLEFLIDKENSKRYKSDKDKQLLQSLIDSLKTYNEEVRFLQEAISHSGKNSSFDLKDVRKWEEELYDLPVHGRMLKENMKVVLRAEDAAMRYHQTNVTTRGNKNRSSASNWLGSWNPFKSNRNPEERERGRSKSRNRKENNAGNGKLGICRNAENEIVNSRNFPG